MTDISVQNLKKSFEVGHPVLDGLSFEVAAGERVGILGANGCGKTTLFRILSGELEPDEGTAAIRRGRRVGLISQIPVYPEAGPQRTCCARRTAVCAPWLRACRSSRRSWPRTAAIRCSRNTTGSRTTSAASAATIWTTSATAWQTASTFPRKCGSASSPCSPAAKRPV